MSQPPLRILITGGTGFIGYHLARYYVERGAQVVLFDNLAKQAGVDDPDLTELLRHPRCQLERVDLTQRLSALAVPPDFDVVYHLAAINGTRLFYERPYYVASTNVAVSLNLLEWLKGGRVGRLVYSSTSEVYAEADRFDLLKLPTDETVPVVFSQPTAIRFSYGTSKFMGEMLTAAFSQENGIPYSIIRYHNIYGPRMGNKHVIPEFLARALQQENPFALFGGNETRAFCYVSDAVRATALVGETGATAAQIVHIGNPHEELRIDELARKVCHAVGYEPALEERGGKAGSVKRRCPDITKLQTLTGFKPEVGIADGLALTLNWYRPYLGDKNAR